MHTRVALALALLLTLAARPAHAGELIRYRTPDGSVGFVDDEKRLPPGVEIVSRTPLDPPAPPAPPPPDAEPEATAAPAAASATSEPPAAAAAPTAATPPCDALADVVARTRCVAARDDRCLHYGLAPGCDPAQVAAAEDWCARGQQLLAEVAAIEDERDAALARHDDCLRRGGLRPNCDEGELDDAERAVRGGERRVEALEEQCQEEGCLPGWVRESCGYDPGA